MASWPRFPLRRLPGNPCVAANPGGWSAVAHKELSAGEGHFCHTASSLVDNYSSEVSPAIRISAAATSSVVTPETRQTGFIVLNQSSGPSLIVTN